MTITAMTPDGVAHQFPDGTSGDVITSAMQDYVSKTPQPSASPSQGATDAANDSYTNDLKAGVGGAMNDLGGLAQGVGLTSAGNWLRNNAPQPDAAYTGRGGSFLPDLKAGQFSRAAGDLTHGLASGSAESALEAGGAVAGGALGSVIGPEGTAAGAIGGGLGAGAIGGALGLGRHARLAAANRAVTGSDLANAAPAAAGDAVISGLTMGRVPGGVLGRMAAQGTGGAAQSTLDQYADTGKVDPDQVANAAASGAAFGGVTGAGHTLPATLGKVATNLQSRGEAYQAPSAEHAASYVRAYDDFQARKAAADAAPGKSPSDTELANQIKGEYKTDAQRRINEIKARGSDAAYDYAQNLLHDASVHNSTLDPAALDKLENMDHGLSEENFQQLRQRLLDTDTISNQSIQKRQVGPISALVGTAAPWVGAGSALLAGHPILAGEIALGHKQVGSVATRLASALDSAAGIAQPTLGLKALAAQRGGTTAVAPIPDFQPASYVPMGKPLAPPPIRPAAQPPVSVPLAPPPIRPAAQPPVSVPLAPPPIQRAQPVDPLMANGVTPKAPLAPPPIIPARGVADASDPRVAGLLASMGGGPMDTHGRPINDPNAHAAAIQAYRGDAMRAAMQADNEAPGAGLGAIITDIMDTHHNGYADPSLPAEAKAAIRADTRQKTLAMKRGRAEAAMAMVAPEHKPILAKYLTPSLLNHG